MKEQTIVFTEMIARNFHTFLRSITHRSTKFNESQQKINRNQFKAHEKKKKKRKNISLCVGKRTTLGIEEQDWNHHGFLLRV